MPKRTVSRLSAPPPSSPPNGESGGYASPRYMRYYTMFKSPPLGGGATPTSSGSNNEASFAYNRSIRMSVPSSGSNPVTSVPPRSLDRNGHATGSAGRTEETDWCGGAFISKFLLVSFVLFFVIIAGLYLRQNMFLDPKGLTGSVQEKSGGNIPKSSPLQKKKAAPPQLPALSMVYPVCGTKGTDPKACIPKEVVKNSRTLFKALKEELVSRARRKGCVSDVQEVISLQEARTLLYKLTEMRKAEVDEAFLGMLLLVTENPRQGLRLTLDLVTDKDISSSMVASGLDMQNTRISAPDVNPDFICGIKALLVSIAMVASVLVGLIGVGVIAWKLYVIRRQWKKSEEEEVFSYVERVLELLQAQFELSENAQGPCFLAVNHVRDELLPPQDRLRKNALWNQVVYYISNNESRVREEIQHISGEEFRVWRWIPSTSPQVSKRFSTANSGKLSRHSMPVSPMASPFTSTPNSPAPGAGTSARLKQTNLYPSLSPLNGDAEEDDELGGVNSDPNSNKWQGQAFETCDGSPNALPSTPTTCLKIRHMFTERDSDRTRIEQEILGKCRNAKILHIGIDKTSVEGCVYIRCLTKEDARMAFMALHGWWFDGHLLSVKFLREERYFSRFPEAKSCTVPKSLVS